MKIIMTWKDPEYLTRLYSEVVNHIDNPNLSFQQAIDEIKKTFPLDEQIDIEFDTEKHTYRILGTK